MDDTVTDAAMPVRRVNRTGGGAIFAAGDVAANDVSDAELRSMAAGAQDAGGVILRALRDANVHPFHAMNALLNVWHTMASTLTPDQVFPALDAMRSFHQAWLVSSADA